MMQDAWRAGFLPCLLLIATGSAGAASPAITEIRYSGHLDLEAHFAHPGDTHPYLSEQRYVTDGRGRVRFEWTTWAEGDTARIPETILIVAEAVYDRPDPSSRWQKLSGNRARQARLEALSGLPEDLERIRPVKDAAWKPRL